MFFFRGILRERVRMRERERERQEEDAKDERLCSFVCLFFFESERKETEGREREPRGKER